MFQYMYTNHNMNWTTCVQQCSLGGEMNTAATNCLNNDAFPVHTCKVFIHTGYMCAVGVRTSIRVAS